jgi:hypothetical protein
MVQSISCRSEGEARKKLHGEDCAESFGILEAQWFAPSRKIFGTFAVQFP